MNSFENPSSSNNEEMSPSEKKLEQSRETFEEEVAKKSEDLDIPPEEQRDYIHTYALHQKADREELEKQGKEGVKERDETFQPGSLPSKLKNNELHARTELEYERTKLKRQTELATRDPLTGLLNRRAFEEEVEKRQAIIRKLEQQPKDTQDHRTAERRHEKPKHYCIMFIDADRFKSVNTRYGHDTGDTVLKGISEIIQKNIRENEGVVARWGGEEMVALVPTNIDVACKIADRIRKAVKNASFSTGGNIAFQVTVSVGVAPYHEQVSKQIKTADMAVQAAKGDFDSVEKLVKELEEDSGQAIIVQKNPEGDTRDQVQYVKDGALSKYTPLKETLG